MPHLLPRRLISAKLDNSGDAYRPDIDVDDASGVGTAAAAAAADSVTPADVSASAPAAAAAGAAGTDWESADLLAGARTGLRVPPHLGWAQVTLAMPGLALAIVAACLTGGSAGGRSQIDLSELFGLPLWCSMSILLCGILALCYARQQLRKLLAAYRASTGLSLLLHSVGLLPLPADSAARQQIMQPLRTVQSLLLAAGWCLLLACCLSDLCVGRSLCQVADIFGRAVCRHRRPGRRAASFADINRSASVDRLDSPELDREAHCNDSCSDVSRYKEAPAVD